MSVLEGMLAIRAAGLATQLKRMSSHGYQKGKLHRGDSFFKSLVRLLSEEVNGLTRNVPASVDQASAAFG